jgi:hypothetical protein
MNIRDELDDVTALVAFLQQIVTDSNSSMNEQSKNGQFLFVTNILDRLNSINKQLDQLKLDQPKN